jgi:hypothetical protein
MYIDDLIGSDVQVSKAALRATANSALTRAVGIALRLAGMFSKHIGNGVDGYNDLQSAIAAAKDKAVFLNAAGRDSDSLEALMHRLMSLYLSVNARLENEQWHKPMSVDEAVLLLSTDRQYDKTEGAEYIAALAKVLGESEDNLRARQAKQASKDAERNRDLAPLASTLLESCVDAGDSGESEDKIFTDLPVTVQFGIFAKAVDAAANQLDRDIDRSMRYVNSKSSVLRNLSISDTAAGKIALNDLEAQFTKFIEHNRDTLDV